MWPFKTVEEKNEIKREFQIAADIYLKHRENIEEFLIECDLQCFKHISKHRLLNPFVIHYISNKKLFGMYIINSISLTNLISFLTIGIGFLSWIPIPVIVPFVFLIQFAFIAFQTYLFKCDIKISSILYKIEIDKIDADAAKCLLQMQNWLCKNV